MNKLGVEQWALELVDQNPGNLMDPNGFVIHLRDTYDIGGETVDVVCSNYPGLKEYLHREVVALAAGLHDIGRPLDYNQLFHELRGARLVEQQGLEKGVAEYPIDLVIIAQMGRPHFVVYEQWDDEANSEARSEFEPLDSGLLVPRTWAEAIVVYSDLSNVNGERVSFEWRLEDVGNRYTTDPRFTGYDSLVDAMKIGLKRVYGVCESVQRLRDGTLSEQEIKEMFDLEARIPAHHIPAIKGVAPYRPL